ncbi:ATP-dependent helicase, partial [candidate division FCPU426 bacterium]|nr:ATP-dependent helicase [candidate division FCPU426 bacterium]
MTTQEQILEGLNASQHGAVTHGLGPQLVVAGAGTGKTTVITRRIAYLVAAKRCSAREILALTFTDKAAEEMESRVDVLVPYGFTDSTICTFHAFGDRLLREQGLLLGINTNYKVLSASDQLVFLREHLFELPLNKFRPLSDPTRHLQFILQVISRAKDEDVSPGDYLHYCEQLEARNIASPNEAETAFWEKHLELARVYDKYQQLLLQKGLVDFGDLITLALQLLRSQPDVLAEVRRRYQYVLVDEFQDTNAAQFELLRLLAKAEGNITVVGDDDQSIYKFRGAAISNILQFTRYYPGARVTVLNENYRSPQSVLDAAYRLIRYNNPERLEVKNNINKRLRAQKGQGLPVTFRGFETVSAEADWIARDILERQKPHQRAWSDFAILVRTNRQADPFLRALNMSGIPCRFSGLQGLYRRPEVKLCMAFLRVLANPHDPLPFHELAESEAYCLPPEDLACLSAESRSRNKSLKAILELVLQGAGAKLSQSGREAGARLLADIAEYVELARNRSTGQVLYRFLTANGILAKYTGADTIETDMKIKNIAKFFNVVQRYEYVAQSDRVLHFVQHLDMLEEVGDETSSMELDEDADAVSLLTVHRAKGLEFSVVYLVSLAANRFPVVNRTPAMTLPLELAKEDLPGGDPFLAEERRLFYVAMTRAREELLFT